MHVNVCQGQVGGPTPPHPTHPTAWRPCKREHPSAESPTKKFSPGLWADRRSLHDRSGHAFLMHGAACAAGGAGGVAGGGSADPPWLLTARGGPVRVHGRWGPYKLTAHMPRYGTGMGHKPEQRAVGARYRKAAPGEKSGRRLPHPRHASLLSSGEAAGLGSIGKPADGPSCPVKGPGVCTLPASTMVRGGPGWAELLASDGLGQPEPAVGASPADMRGRCRAFAGSWKRMIGSRATCTSRYTSS